MKLKTIIFLTIIEILLGVALSKAETFPDTSKGLILHWNRNTEADLAGYTIRYKQANLGVTYLPVNDTLKTWNRAELCDDSLWLAVSAYDISGNQSPYTDDILVKWVSGNVPEPPPSNVNIPYLATNFSDWNRLGIVLWENRDKGWGLYTFQIAPNNPISYIQRAFQSVNAGTVEISFRYAGSPRLEIYKEGSAITLNLPYKDYATDFTMPLTLTKSGMVMRLQGEFFIEKDSFKILGAGQDVTPPAMPKGFMVRELK